MVISVVARDGEYCSEMSGSSSLLSIYVPREWLPFKFLCVSEIRIPSQCLRGFNLLYMLVSRPVLLGWLIPVSKDSQGLFPSSLGMGDIWSQLWARFH